MKSLLTGIFAIYIFIGGIHSIAAVGMRRLSCGFLFCGSDISGFEYFMICMFWPFIYYEQFMKFF